MASIVRIVLSLAAIATASASAAQGLAGPLAGPEASLPAKPMKHSASHRSNASVATRRIAMPASARLPVEQPAVPVAATGLPKPAAPVDPVSFGMKWNGSNDSAGQTRIENLNGNAAGTGAEVGMKLHF